MSTKIGMQKKSSKYSNVVLLKDKNGNKGYIKEHRKYSIRNANKNDSYYINYNDLIPTDSFLYHKRKKLTPRDKSIIGMLIFEEIMDKIFDDMIENKSTYRFPNSVKLIIGQTKKGIDDCSFFTYDTRECIRRDITNAEAYGYTWNIYVSRRLHDKLKHYTEVKKQKYIRCKTLIGKQLLASYRGKLNS